MKYLINYDNHKSSSIDDYYNDFNKIWSRDFNERSAFDLWLHVVDHASRVAKAIRKQRPADVIDDIADTSVWIFSFIAHCNQSTNQIDENFKLDNIPSEIIWNKYPNICPSCFDFIVVEKLIDNEKLLSDSNAVSEVLRNLAHEYPGYTACTCISRETNYVKERDLIKKNRVQLDEIRVQYAKLLENNGCKPRLIDDYQNMFDGIYKHINRVVSLDEMAFHLLEEVGEATRAFKDLYTFDDSREPYTSNLQDSRKRDLYEELADIFSWLFTIVLKLQATYVTHAMQYIESISSGIVFKRETSSLSFSEIIWAKYGRTKSGANLANLICPGCQGSPCSCPRDLKINWNQINYDNSTEKGSNDNMPNSNRNLVFISYSHKDSEWLEKLKIMLKPLVRNRTISTWSDRDIEVGQKWEREIESALLRTKVAVMLVSDNFLASDFIADNELPPLLKGAEEGGTKIIWVPISACLVDETDIGSYQAALSPGTPLDSMSESDAKTALASVCKKIKSMS